MSNSWIRQKRFYKRLRTWLLVELGGVCSICKSSEELELDVRIPIGERKETKEKHHCMSSNQRITFYRKQYEVGNLQLLCSKCNSRKGDSFEFTDIKELPF